jgi:hypothetical protein
LTALTVNIGDHLVTVTLERAVALIVVFVTSCAIATRFVHALLLPLRAGLVLRPPGNSRQTADLFFCVIIFLVGRRRFRLTTEGIVESGRGRAAVGEVGCIPKAHQLQRHVLIRNDAVDGRVRSREDAITRKARRREYCVTWASSSSRLWVRAITHSRHAILLVVRTAVTLG